MAEIYNYGLRGVNSDVRFGKGNARVVGTATDIALRNPGNTDYTNLLVANIASSEGGTEALPVITFRSELDTGIFSPATNVIAISANAETQLTIQNPGSENASVIFAGSAAVTLPVGTELERPSTPTSGMIRFNDDDNLVEFYNGTEWNQLGDKSRINDADDVTYVDTDEVAGQITMGADDSGTSRVLANWYVAETGAAAARLDFESRQDEFAIIAEGTGTDIDIRLVPKGAGTVFIGETGSSVLSADDGESLTVQGGNNPSGNGGSLNLFGGDSSGANGNGGNIIIQAGDADGSGTDGITIVRDANGNNVVQFIGVTSAVNYFTMTNSATSNDVIVAAAGTDANVDIAITGKGTGQVVINSGGNAFGLPNSIGTSGYFLQTDGAGQTSWAEVNLASTMRVIEVEFDFSDADTNIVTLPAGHRVITMSVYVATAFDQPIELGVAGDTDFWMPPSTISQSLADAEYVRTIPYNQRNNTANAVRLTTTATVGTGTVTVQYFVP